ncbi:MAG TPA: glycosyltransferase family 2 protein [Saprospiraceae bacterium]|nr:glycosyltransferase family 2 protein [Saprospiraceae bacterium]HMQ82426.1 glycosyltransferase family 2 protein [Saprospiraceae bacterium]
MITVIAYTVLGIYTAALLYITVYCLMQFNLLIYYKKHQRKEAESAQGAAADFAEATLQKAAQASQAATHMAVAGDFDDEEHEEHPMEEYPFVTVQLPIYNEMYVIERLIDSIAQFDYPKDRFEIHILDDSTDETLEITRKKVEEYQAKGLNIQQIIRENRTGFKAGALRDGMAHAKGEFIAIFDADFLPRPNFLSKTIPHFIKDENVGVVQTRWEHINEDFSLITRLQALQLNVHFTVEQVGRMEGDYMLQFNGTAGVWRRKTIDEAGGWQSDTLTEDFDLSIRAQLKGWKIKYLEEIGSPAELPAEMNSFKSQQFRWMKGGAETAKKMLPTVWQSKLSLRQKIHATSHLLASTIFVFVFITGLFSVPLMFLLGELIEHGFSKNFFAYFLAGLLSIIAVYYVANLQSPARRREFDKSLFDFLVLFPLFLALSMGLSLHNTVAVIQGYLGKKSPFVRTPKFNIQTIKDNFMKNNYLPKQLSWTTVLEGVLALYFLGAVVGGLYIQNTTFIVFHLMLAIGYGTIFYYTLRHFNLK